MYMYPQEQKLPNSASLRIALLLSSRNVTKNDKIWIDYHRSVQFILEFPPLIMEHPLRLLKEEK